DPVARKCRRRRTGILNRFSSDYTGVLLIIQNDEMGDSVPTDEWRTTPRIRVFLNCVSAAGRAVREVRGSTCKTVAKATLVRIQYPPPPAKTAFHQRKRDPVQGGRRSGRVPPGPAVGRGSRTHGGQELV